MARDFMEERRQQLIEEELERTITRLFGPPGSFYRELYSQCPTLNLLLKHRSKTSPYTQPIKK